MEEFKREEKPKKRIGTKPLFSLGIFGVLAIGLLILDWTSWLGWFLVAAFLILAFLPNQKIMDFYEEEVVIYLNDKPKDIIKYDEVESWRMIRKTKNDLLEFVLKDKRRVQVKVVDPRQAIGYLKKIMPNKTEQR